MSLHINFGDPGQVAYIGNLSIGKWRIHEVVAAGNTSTASAEKGEMGWIYNAGAAAYYVAHGETPDASATEKTGQTSARYIVKAGQYFPVDVKAGDKFAVATVS